MEIRNLKFELRDDGILLVRPQGPLQKEDFVKLAEMVDPWIKIHNQLNGVVISVKKFPGWESFGSFISHIKFVNAHERKVERVALAVDGILPEIIANLTKHFIKAKIKQFSFSDLDEAIAWAKGDDMNSKISRAAL
jgi:hypothetical protein